MAEEKTNWLLWIAGGFILLLIWGNMSKKSASHPLNSVSIMTGLPVASCAQPTSGDSFGNGIPTTVAGVCEPNRSCGPMVPRGSCNPNPVRRFLPPPISVQHCCHMMVRRSPIGFNSGQPPVPIHVTFPVEPTPLPPVVIKAPITVAPLPTKPTRPVLSQPAWCGNGHGWCIERLNQLANNPGCRNEGVGCGAF